VLEVDDASLSAVVRVLDEAGFAAVVHDAPLRWDTSQRQAGVWVRVPGEDAYATVIITELAPGDRPGTWRDARGHKGADTVRGYRVGFHERPLRTRGHDYGSAAKRVHCVFLDDVVATVREWSEWESTWSVTPVLEPAARRLRRMRGLAASKLGSGSVPVDVDVDPLMLGLLDAAQVTAMHALVDELFLPGIRWRFPRDKNGTRLAARTQVLLHECAPPAHPSQKGVWLVVDGPVPRTEPRLTVRLVRAAGRSAQHRWDRTPGYWRPTGARTIELLWGVGPRANLDLIGEVTDALLAGRMLEALATCGVTIDRGTQRLLSGLPDCFGLREWTDKWVTNATDMMATAAPWRWRDAMVAKQRPHRMQNLGGFNPNRRPGLFLQLRDGRPHVTFDQSATPLVLPRVCWERDVDYDLTRLGLLTPDQIPV